VLANLPAICRAGKVFFRTGRRSALIRVRFCIVSGLAVCVSQVLGCLPPSRGGSPKSQQESRCPPSAPLPAFVGPTLRVPASIPAPPFFCPLSDRPRPIHTHLQPRPGQTAKRRLNLCQFIGLSIKSHPSLGCHLLRRRNIARGLYRIEGRISDWRQRAPVLGLPCSTSDLNHTLGSPH
jgi:hypothetical protein